MYETLILERQDCIAVLTLNQPELRNALSHRMAEEFEAAVHEVGRDPQVRFLVLTGKGDSFSAGGDFNSVMKDFELPPVEFKVRVLGFYRRYLCIREVPIPTLAAVNGHAMGAGAALALACDMRIASTRAQFGMSFVKLGVHPGMGTTYFLPRAVGSAKAFELLLTGDPISAQEALALGMVNRVVSPEELIPEAMALARKITSLPQTPIRYMKRSIYMGLTSGLPEVLEFESFAQALCSQTEELHRAIASFRERGRGRSN
jgi:enoyl-CoA hydratase/carnithine racemase